jgi:hypothetical protein
MIEDDIKDIASKEAEEAEEDAEYREDREAYELRCASLQTLFVRALITWKGYLQRGMLTTCAA